ncbi:MAG: hypothetical protein P8J29_11445 [Rhodospirillales bacterium]|nr:hypothetical protein [Rhodospirillales bacterium]
MAKRGIHFVGSLGMSDVEAGFRFLSEKIGVNARRYPDGEPGDRANWIRFQIGMLNAHPNIELIRSKQMQAGGEQFNRPYYRTVHGTQPGDIEFGELGYADAAQISYEIFNRLKKEGVISSDIRFQVCLPTPAAVIGGFIDPEQQAAIEPAYERAMLAEVDLLINKIPNSELSIQWDIAHEPISAEGGGPGLYYGDIHEGTVERVCRLSDAVPQTVELGLHLCYGDPGHKHIIEPSDLSVCVEFSNGFTVGTKRSIEWIHMPVPRDRNDKGYFEALSKLKLAPETELILGLVHHTGGIEGTRQRIETATQYIKDFAISTECGLGRREPSTLNELMDLHISAANI